MIDSGPEKILETTRAPVTVMSSSARLLVSSPDWEVHAVLDATDLGEHDTYRPPWEAVQQILKSLSPTIGRLSIRFDRRG